MFCVLINFLNCPDDLKGAGHCPLSAAIYFGKSVEMSFCVSTFPTIHNPHQTHSKQPCLIRQKTMEPLINRIKLSGQLSRLVFLEPFKMQQP